MWSLVRRWFRGLRRPADAGAAGERLAERFLRSQRSLRIVARNWRNPRDLREEIDLVALDGEILVFVEVKARSAAALVPGYFTVNVRKKKVLRRACLAYVRGLAKRPRTIRFDIVEVAHGGRGGPRVLHFENVPLFAKHDRP